MPSALEDKASRVHASLIDHYGFPEPKPTLDPLSELVMTILSQNTADVNSHRAYRSLRQRFADWEQVLAADTAQVVEAIRIGGLANIKAPRIQRILRELKEERGALDLGFLSDLPLQEARDYLNGLPGVGPKTTACVLLFSLHRPSLPVDTHVHRVAKRIGLVPPKATAEKTNVLLEKLLPAEAYYPFHLNVIRLGRTLCKSSRRQCQTCPLLVECDFAGSQSARDDQQGQAASP